MVVPTDVYTQLCVSLARQQDAFLLLTQRVCKAVEKYGDDKLLDDVTVIVQGLNAHTTDMQSILRSIIEEQPTEATHGRA